MQMNKRLRIGLGVFGVAILVVQFVLVASGHPKSALWWSGFATSGIALWMAITDKAS